jgi:hypothetical protein
VSDEIGLPEAAGDGRERLARPDREENRLRAGRLPRRTRADDAEHRHGPRRREHDQDGDIQESCPPHPDLLR